MTDMIILDLETTGLDPLTNTILEIGILTLKADLTPIAQWSAIVSDQTAIAHLDWLERLYNEWPDHKGEEPWSGAKIVHEMHQKSGLAAEIRATHASGIVKTLTQVEQEAIEFMGRQGLGVGRKNLPLTGSSILFDRRYLIHQMPLLDAQFHYRNTDCSSLKNLVQIYRPDLAARVKDEVKPVGAHRSLSDCHDTVAELRFYITNTVLQGVPQA